MTGRRSESGMSVIELVVATMIMSIVTLIVFSFLNGMTSVTARTDRNSRAEGDAQLTFRAMTAEIRSAFPITGTCTGGYGDCISFDIQRPDLTVHTCQRRSVTYALNRTQGTVTRSQTDFTYSAATKTCTSVVRNTNTVVLRSVEMPAGTPLFRYYDSAGVELRPAVAAELAKIPTAPNAGGTASVKINVLIRYQRNAPLINLASDVVLRNNR